MHVANVHVLLRSSVLISDVCMSVAQGFLCEFCIDSKSFEVKECLKHLISVWTC